MTHGYNYMPKYGSPVADTAEKAAAMARATGDPGSLVAAVDGGLLSAEQGRRGCGMALRIEKPLHGVAAYASFSHVRDVPGRCHVC